MTTTTPFKDGVNPGLTRTSRGSVDTDLTKKEDRGRKGRKKLSKEDIGEPSDSRHVAHAGWDPEQGFNTSLERDYQYDDSWPAADQTKHDESVMSTVNQQLSPNVRNSREKKRELKKSLSKDDIGPPTDCKHIQHVGYDINRSFDDAENMESGLTDSFERCGLADDGTNTRESSPFDLENGSGSSRDSTKGGMERRKAKLSREDISSPMDFRHVGHLGYNADGGFNVDSVDPDMKFILDQHGLKEYQLKDPDTVAFVQNFIEQYGGFAQYKQEQKEKYQRQQSVDENAPPSSTSNGGKDSIGKERKKKPRLSKDEIGVPEDFRHVGHIGWDPSDRPDQAEGILRGLETPSPLSPRSTTFSPSQSPSGPPPPTTRPPPIPPTQREPTKAEQPSWQVNVPQGTPSMPFPLEPPPPAPHATRTLYDVPQPRPRTKRFAPDPPCDTSSTGLCSSSSQPPPPPPPLTKPPPICPPLDKQQEQCIETQSSAQVVQADNLPPQRPPRRSRASRMEQDNPDAKLMLPSSSTSGPASTTLKLPLSPTSPPGTRPSPTSLRKNDCDSPHHELPLSLQVNLPQGTCGVAPPRKPSTHSTDLQPSPDPGFGLLAPSSPHLAQKKERSPHDIEIPTSPRELLELDNLLSSLQDSTSEGLHSFFQDPSPLPPPLLSNSSAIDPSSFEPLPPFPHQDELSQKDGCGIPLPTLIHEGEESLTGLSSPQRVTSGTLSLELPPPPPPDIAGWEAGYDPATAMPSPPCPQQMEAQSGLFELTSHAD